MNYKVCLYKINEETLPYIVDVINAENEKEAEIRAKKSIARTGYWGINNMSMEDKMKRLVIKSIIKE